MKRLEIRKVINGKAYDTTTAERVALIEFKNLGRSDFHWERTDIYKTEKGQWFIAGEGGACSSWSSRDPDGGANEGYGITLLDPDEAREMLEYADGPIESYFEIEEG